jgi:hypothetical protein
MILTDLGPVTAYRMHTPRWATMPAIWVLADDVMAADDTLQVYDPLGALPKNQDSWR